MCKDQRADGCQASDILRSDVSIVHTAVDELVNCVGRPTGNLNCVVDLVVHLAISALHLGNLAIGDTAQICLNFDELGYTLCRRCKPISLLRLGILD